MPIYEYACTQCRHQFEALVRNADAPECPSCHSQALERRLSVFAAHTAGAARSVSPRIGSGQAGPCGTCGDPRGPGSCSLNS